MNLELKSSKNDEEMVSSKEDIRSIYVFNPKVIGHGHFGTVRKAKYVANPKKAFAVKTIAKSKIKTALHLIKRELAILK